MARRPPTQQPAAQERQLTPEQISNGIRRIKKRIEEIERFDPATVQKRRAPEVRAIEAAIGDTLAEVFGHDTTDYRRYARATSLDHGGIDISAVDGLSLRDNAQDAHRYLAEGKHEAVLLLTEAVRALEERLEGLAARSPAVASESIGLNVRSDRKVFIVHGRDDGTKETVARFVEKLGLEAVILHERPNKGRTLITKFREESTGVGFAIVLMTPDDVGKAANAADLRPRARQNVVFELGFFIGAIQPARVAAIVKGDIERPSDFDGVVYIPLEGNWRSILAKELIAAGMDIDLESALG